MEDAGPRRRSKSYAVRQYDARQRHNGRTTRRSTEKGRQEAFLAPYEYSGLGTEEIRCPRVVNLNRGSRRAGCCGWIRCALREMRLEREKRLPCRKGHPWWKDTLNREGRAESVLSKSSLLPLVARAEQSCNVSRTVRCSARAKDQSASCLKSGLNSGISSRSSSSHAWGFHISTQITAPISSTS